MTREVKQLLKDMEETLGTADGLGLAAPQVGSNLRLCLVRIADRITPLINPVLTFKSQETATAEEGCLSLPNVWLAIPRSLSVVVRYTNAKGAEEERMLSDLDARIVQHEVDHLDGVLITDYADAKEILRPAAGRTG